MKDLLVLLVLLIAELWKVCPLAYQPESYGECRDPRKYMTASELCCSKCQPGHRLVKECTETTDTVCEPCGPDQFMENWNYALNCFSCPKCKAATGMIYSLNCSATSKSRCTCQPGMYCSMGYDAGSCTVCQRYWKCKAGFGVINKVTENENARCKPCVDGTFSDKLSYTDPCRPHTDCGDRAVVRKGNATTDTVCEASATEHSNRVETVLTTASTVTATHPVTSVQTVTVSTQSHISPDVTNQTFHTKNPTTDTGSGFQTAVATCGVIAVLFLIAIIPLCLCKFICKKDTERPHHKIDANGNSESCDQLQLTHGCTDEIKMMSSGVNSLEQQCLLEKGEANSDYSQYSNNTESLARTCGSSSQESIGPLQPTVALNNNQSSVLSEPMPLISNTNTESSVHTPSSPQPTSPQIINPVTTSPHVNVNITFHIGNGTGGTQSVMSTDLKQADCKLPFGEEEESFSIPQQEDGKRSLMSVQESTSYCVELPA